MALLRLQFEFLRMSKNESCIYLRDDYSKENSKCQDNEADCTWHIPVTIRKPVWLEWCE